MRNLIVAVIALVLIGAVAAAYWSYRRASGEADAAAVSIRARAKPPAGLFVPTLVADMPEIAQRYFNHAIAPGTPLQTTVELRMEGTFRLGDRTKPQNYAMTARQWLGPPGDYVWMAEMQSGLLHISGSDGLVAGAGWTRFWMAGLLPVVNVPTSPDLVRSALTRAAIEGIWAPASLLPGNDVTWEQIGDDTARLHFTTGIEPVDLTLGPDGRVLAMVTKRWSNANPDALFRLQPFGGTIKAEAAFGGYTIPSMITVGNHFTTPEYFPFFEATVTGARYW